MVAACVSLWTIATNLNAQEPQHLRVDLTGPNRRVGTLNFDEPIRVIGLVPAYVDSVRPFRASGRTALDRDCTPIDKLEPAGERWVRTGPERPDSVPPDTFDLVLKPLRADRTYLLCLRTAGGIPDTMLTRLQRGVAASVDTILRRMVPQNGRLRGLEPEESREILSRFVTSLKPLQPPQAWVLPPKSIFRGDLDDTTRISQLVQIRAPIIDRAETVENLTRTGQRLKARLETFGSTHATPLGRLLNTIGASDTVAGWQVASVPGTFDALRLVLRTTHPRATALDSQTLAFVAFGQAPASDTAIVPQLDLPEPLNSIWTGAEGAAYLERVRLTRRSFEGLRSLVSALAISDVAQRRTGLSEPEVASLRNALDDISTDLYDLHSDARALHAHNVSRERSVLAAVQKLSVTDEGQTPVLTSTVAVDFTARAKRYISPDLGVAYAPALGEAVPYLGVTFFPFGLNRNVPQRGFRPWHSTFGLMLGLSATSVAKAEERKDLFGSSNLLLGGTVRFLDVFRASAGGMALRQLDPGTLSTDAPVRLTTFAALSFDLDVKSLFGGISTILGGGK